MLIDIVTKGATDRSVVLRIIDSTDGTPETGVVFNTSGIDMWYRREGAAVVSITEVTLAALTTAHTDGGFLAVSHGYYRLDLPDAAFATGANYVDVGGTVTGMVVIGGRVRLTDFSIEVASQVVASVTGAVGSVTGAVGSVASGGITAASFAADAITAAKIAADVTTELQTGLATAANLATVAGYIDTEVAAIKAVTDKIDTAVELDGAVYRFTTNALEQAPTGGGAADGSGFTSIPWNAAWDAEVQSECADALNAYDPPTKAELDAAVAPLATAAALATVDDFIDTEVSAIKTKTDFLPSATAGAAGGLFIAGSNAATSITTALTANITGNLSGSVGSVTGAVGSVTGAVGSVTGNVTGSVGSLAAQAKADVNAEVLDVLVTDTFAESSAVPAATASLKDKIAWMATLSRNKVTQTATTQLVRNDADSGSIGTSTLSDDGTTFIRGEFS